ncbi:MAG: zinc transport system ATP-binding protein [Frankiaceae bacterium]|nr:zinc transport system ATP-binding protein [Frankiaceae bacterium]
MTAALYADRVRVTFGTAVAVDDVTLSVGAGEFVALLGANGSGKTTLVRALLGLQPVSGGEVRVFGTPLAEFREWPRVGFVPQHPPVQAAMPASVREVVASGRVGRLGWLRRTSAADRAVCAAALDAVGLADRARDPVATLSGGQQQRVLIARALAGEPDVLVLDEPTAGVDRENQAALAGTLRLLKDRGHAMLLVTHHLGPLADLVDRTVVLDGGRVAYDGPVPPGGMASDDDHHHPLPPRGERLWESR